MTDPRPAPYPADTRAKGWRFELDYEQIEQSGTWAAAMTAALDGLPLARPFLLAMWYAAWKQIPCGSLPTDDRELAGAIGIPSSVFVEYRDILLRGWWLADDGRMYHDTIAARVLSMLGTRGTDRARQEARRNLFEVIRDRDGGACVYCGHTKYLTLDHLLPLSRGGDNDELNLAIACRPCNSKKRDRTPEEAGMQFVSLEAERRWKRRKESGGESRTASDVGGYTQTNNTRTGTGTTTNPPSPSVMPPAAPLAPPPKRAKAAPPPCPDDVAAQVWTDWLALRSKKRAPVTATVVDEARNEAAKAGMSLEQFLRVWCARGSQGLQAEWLKPHERSPPQGASYRERDSQAAADRVAEMTGGLVVAKPPASRRMEILDASEELG